jgi:CRP-like cAMP-binding protein
MAGSEVCVPAHNSQNCAAIADVLGEPLKRIELQSRKTCYHRNQVICGQSEPAKFFYKVISGAARRYVVRWEGRRQIVDLLLPGDFWGLTAKWEYDSTMEAVSEGTVLAIFSRRHIEALADDDPAVARAIREVAFESMSRLQSQLLVVGRTTAIEKVGAFLLEMMTRLSDPQAEEMILPVSRYDIADYLAVSVETVSRSLSELKDNGVIALHGTRHVRIIDREALDHSEEVGA